MILATRSSRLRAQRCKGARSRVARPWHVVACTDVDGTERMLPWFRAVVAPALSTEMAIVAEPLRPWDREVDERAFVAAELRTLPLPVVAPRRVVQARGGAQVPPPMYPSGRVSPDALAAALADLPRRGMLGRWAPRRAA